MQRRDQLIGSKRPRSGQKGADGAAPALDGSSSGSGSGSDEDAADEGKHKRRKHKHGKHKHSKSKSARKAKESKSKDKKRRPDKAEAAKSTSVCCSALMLLFTPEHLACRIPEHLVCCSCLEGLELPAINAQF